MKTASVENFIRLEKDVSEKKGGFFLFALFAREDLPDRWDLVFSAPWSKNANDAVEYIVAEIKSKLGAEELTNLSRIVFVQPTDPAVQAINRAIRVEHGTAEVRDSHFFGVPIRHAYIITSKAKDAVTAKQQPSGEL